MDLRLWISDQLGTFVKVTVCSRVSVFQTDRWPLFNRPCQAILLLGESSFMPEHNRTGGVDRHRPGDILKDGVWRWVPSSAWSLNAQLMNMFSSCIIRGRESVESEFLGGRTRAQTCFSRLSLQLSASCSPRDNGFPVCLFVLFLFFRDVLFLIKLMFCEQTAPLIIVRVTVCRGCPNQWNWSNYNSGWDEFL